MAICALLCCSSGPSIKKVSSTRSPRVVILASKMLMWWRAPIERTVDGFHARVVQHECDHLIGKLYPMRIRDFGQFGYTEVLFPGLDAADD